jgi:ketosteroid isomerase-like protein
MASTQSEVRALFDSRSEAMRMKDIDSLMALYAPDIVYFDLVPPLQYAGSAALRVRFSEWFEGWEGAIGMKIRDLTIWASGDVAAASMLLRASGTRKNGKEVGYWVRTTNCCQRSNHGWLITHEHVSLPVDFASGSAVMDLVP